MTGGERLLHAGAEELGLCLSSTELEGFSRFAAELVKWNRKINLTAITTEKDIVVKHFLDSLSVAPLVPLEGKLLDIGSGAGFPGIPLCLVRPNLRVISVDAVEKKVLFQRHVARILGLSNFTALHARGESLPASYTTYFDIIISRAFTDVTSFVTMVLPLVADGGSIVAMKGSEGKAECAMAESRLRELGVEVASLHEFSLPQGGDKRSLIVMKRYK